MKNTSDQNDSFQTQDLNLASALVLSGQQIDDICPSKDDSKTLLFVFNDQKKCEQVQEQYWQNKLTGNIRDYVKIFKELRERVLAERQR